MMRCRTGGSLLHEVATLLGSRRLDRDYLTRQVLHYMRHAPRGDDREDLAIYLATCIEPNLLDFEEEDDDEELEVEDEGEQESAQPSNVAYLQEHYAEINEYYYADIYSCSSCGIRVDADAQQCGNCDWTIQQSA